MNMLKVNENIKLINGDCIEEMCWLESNSIDTIITDPPYGLKFMGKEWDNFTDSEAFQEWTRLWAIEALRVAKPGAFMLCFGGARTSHRVACGIEDAGWEIRDTMMWIYGSGFPKSYNISKGIDKKFGVERNTGKLRTDGRGKSPQKINNHEKGDTGIGHADGNKQSYIETIATSDQAKLWDGWGTALKPAWENITVAQKPLERRTVLRYNILRILYQLAEGICQLKSNAKTAELHSKLSQVEQGEVSSIAQSNVVNSINIQDALHELTDILQSEWETSLNLSTALSWLNILGDLCEQMNTLTIEMATSLIIDLKTLSLLPLGDIFQSIILVKKTSQPGTVQLVYLAESLFNAVNAKLNFIPELSAQGNVTSAVESGDLRPKFEPIIVAMKPRDGTFVENALKWGVAGLNIDGSRVPTEDSVTINTWDNGAKPFGDGAGNPYSGREETRGRWPANILHDGSEEVLKGFPNRKSNRCEKESDCRTDGNTSFESMRGDRPARGFNDSGSAARFFYCAKTSKKERNAGLEGMEEVLAQSTGWSGDSMPLRQDGTEKRPPLKANNHPTVKPLSLMKYLCILTKTPTGGIVLDPFMGSGTTGMACKKIGRDFVGIELDGHYFEIAEKRIASVEDGI